MSRPTARRVPARLRRGGVRGVLALVAASAIAAMPAHADPIRGATYTGVAADGASVTFTLSADGTLVDSYRLSDVPGSTCTFPLAEGDRGVWVGAPIVDAAFEYTLYSAILFQGTFPGAQSAAGTFRLYNAATTATAACDSGVVKWTATTTATPPPGSGGSGPPPTGGGKGSQPKKPTFVTRVTLRKVSRTRLGGRIRSSGATCRAGRTVILWRGKRRIATRKSKANGTFSFPRSARVRGRRVRATTSARSTPTAICAAGSSTFVRV